MFNPMGNGFNPALGLPNNVLSPQMPQMPQAGTGMAQPTHGAGPVSPLIQMLLASRGGAQGAPIPGMPQMSGGGGGYAMPGPIQQQPQPQPNYGAVARPWAPGLAALP
jgi:hypothetical protein